jgi:hypothetical protein
MASLQTLPYDLRTQLLCSIKNFQDLFALQQTCKAMNEPFQKNEKSILSAVAPHHFSAYWIELLRLMRAQSMAIGTTDDTRPKVVEEALLASSSNQTITKEELHNLFVLEETIRSIAHANTEHLETKENNAESDTKLFKLLCNVAYVDLLTPGQPTSMLSRSEVWNLEMAPGRERWDSIFITGAKDEKYSDNVFSKDETPSKLGLSEEDRVELSCFVAVALSNSGSSSFMAHIIAHGSGKRCQPLKMKGSGFMVRSGGLNGNWHAFDSTKALRKRF